MLIMCYFTFANNEEENIPKQTMAQDNNLTQVHHVNWEGRKGDMNMLYLKTKVSKTFQSFTIQILILIYLHD